MPGFRVGDKLKNGTGTMPGKSSVLSLAISGKITAGNLRETL
nr:MAG TPA: hypothetical protein [Caudoviricetes sp.]